MISKITIKKVERIENEDGLICRDDCIATISNFLNCDYELMYTGGYTLKRLKNENTLDFASNYSIYLNNYYDNLFLYHGLYSEIYIYTKECDWINAIKNEIDEGRPVMISIDPFWCPWDQWFQVYSNTEGHSFIIKGIEKDKMICVDPYFNIETIDISFENLFKGIIWMRCFKKKEIFFIDYNEIISNLYNSIFSENYIIPLGNLIQDIKESSNIFNEVLPNQELKYSKIYVLLMLINQSLTNLSKEIKYVGEKTSNMYVKLLGEEMRSLSIEFKKIRNLIIKFYYSNSWELKLKIVGRLNSFFDNLKTTEKLLK